MKDEFSCEECQLGWLPTPNKSDCFQLELQHMSLFSYWALPPVVFALLGILLTLFILFVFYRFEDTPVIRASGRELCYILLLGIFLSYVMTFFLVAKPTLLTCSVFRVGLGTSLCLCYSALLTKTNRISRIFNRGMKGMGMKTGYTSPRSQILISLSIVAPQLIGSIVWLVFEPPSTAVVYPEREMAILRCRASNLHIVTSLGYNMLLIALCTAYAVKTRKIPENFNEAKYIAFTMYSTCIVWLAFIPTYFGTSKSDLRVNTVQMYTRNCTKFTYIFVFYFFFF